MTYSGKVKDGVVVLDGGVSLPDGTAVRVEAVNSPSAEASASAGEIPPLFRAGARAKPTGIPDLAINHDHYLYGHPKVKRG